MGKFHQRTGWLTFLRKFSRFRFLGISRRISLFLESRTCQLLLCFSRHWKSFSIQDTYTTRDRNRKTLILFRLNECSCAEIPQNQLFQPVWIADLFLWIESMQRICWQHLKSSNNCTDFHSHDCMLRIYLWETILKHVSIENVLKTRNVHQQISSMEENDKLVMETWSGEIGKKLMNGTFRYGTVWVQW